MGNSLILPMKYTPMWCMATQQATYMAITVLSYVYNIRNSTRCVSYAIHNIRPKVELVLC